MKKLIITLGVLLVFAMSASAQAEGVGMSTKGVKIGLNMSNITGDDVEGTDAKMGVAGGLFFTYNFSPSFAIQPEVLYTMKGFKVDFFGVEVETKLDYIEVPVLFKFTIPTEGNLKPCFFVGPAAAFLMSAKMEELDIKESVKSIDFGIAFGGGFAVVMGDGMMTFDARYTMGMNSIDDTEYDEDIKNSNISFMIGYDM